MRSLLVLCTTVLVSVCAIQTSYPTPPASCHQSESGRGGTNCYAEKPDTIPVLTDAPIFLSSVKNGKRYLGGSGNDTFHVAHLFSETDDLYEMGFALGQLFPKEVNGMWDTLEPWLISMIEQAAPSLPKWLADIVVKYGGAFALEAVYEMTVKYTPKDFIQEWHGIADGANTTLDKVVKVTLFPQLSKASCTILLAHKNATAQAQEGCNQLRALDFDPSSMVADYSSIVVYHYNKKPQLANFGWLVMTGVLTGMNDLPMSAGEKAWGSSHQGDLGLPYGLPWMQMLRRSLEMPSEEAALAYVEASTHPNATSGNPGNTVSIHLGYASQATNQIAAMEVGYNYSKVFGDHTAPNNGTTHPFYNDVVYFPKNFDPHTMCPSDLIKAQYGAMSAEWMAMYYSPNDMTGDTQVAAFDLQNMKVWFANSRKTGKSGPLCAYYRLRTVVDMKEVFAVGKPSLLD